MYCYTSDYRIQEYTWKTISLYVNNNVKSLRIKIKTQSYIFVMNTGLEVVVESTLGVVLLD